MADFPFSPVFALALQNALSPTVSQNSGRLSTMGTGDIPLALRITIARSPERCIYAHFWRNSDPDDLHDHPWDFTSLVVTGGYWEVTEGERLWRPAGSVAFRKATDRHRVELDRERAPDGTLSLIITGPEVREWGFHTAEGFVVGREYRSVQAFRARRAEVSHG